MRKRLLSVLLTAALLLTMLSCGVFAADTQAEDTYPGPDEIWYDENPVEMTLEEYLAQQAGTQSAVAETTLSYSTDYPNTHVNTGNQAFDACCAGLTQIGYTETPDNHTKYNAWFYGADVAVSWCAIFVTWCADQAGAVDSAVARNAATNGYNSGNMSSNPYGCPAYAFGTTAKMGDIAFIGSGTSNHVGLVVGTSDSYVWCVEGNASDSVGLRRYSKTSGYAVYGGGTTGSTRILFYARPNYSGSDISCSITIDDNGNYELTPPDTGTDPELDPDPEPETDPDMPFNDVPQDAWFYKPVKWAADNRLAYGMTDTTFEPYGECTRAQIITFLWRMEGSPKPTEADYYNYTYYHCFTDVPSGTWYYNAVVWGVNNGYVAGITDTTFEPEWTCTRAQALAFLWRIAGRPAASSENVFEDVEEGSWYYNAVLWGSEQGIAYGMTATTYEPASNCTRGQIVAFMRRVYLAYTEKYPDFHD